MSEFYRTLDPRQARKIDKRAGKFQGKKQKEKNKKRFRDEEPPEYNPREFIHA